MVRQKYKLVVFDMDGVLFKMQNFWMHVHKAFGTYDEGKKLTDKYLLTDYEMLVKEVVGRLWKGKDAGPYMRLVHSTDYFTNVLSTFHNLKKKGFKIAIITCGPKHLVDRLKFEGCNYDYASSNNLVIKDNKVVGTFDYPVAEGHFKKIPLLKKICKDAGVDLSQTICVADGSSDEEMFELCGKKIAFCPTSAKIRQMADAVIDKGDLSEILYHLN
ncbi:MAG: HAD family phosphatase [Nanoarchaeota archaeon]|nr:HAD family phosphatase [Nanoarchaeota archaeon]